MSHLQILPAVRERVDPLVERFLDMREKLRWMMAMGGERALLYKRRVTGDVCPNFDYTRKAHRADLEDGCFGTNFVGGYYGPFEVFISLTTVSPIRTVIQEHGLRREFVASHWALWEPRMENKDLIVRRNGERLWVVNVETTKWRHHTLRQLFKAEAIERNNVIYKLPISGLLGV